MQKDVTLSSGQTVTVYSVPLYALNAAENTVEMPAPPTMKIKVMDAEQDYPDQREDSPAYQDYLQKRRIARRKQIDKSNELCLLMALKDVIPPQDFSWFAPLEYNGVKRREGTLGAKLDYIQYELLSSQKDLNLVIDTVTEISFVKEADVQAAQASFPRDDKSSAVGAGGDAVPSA